MKKISVSLIALAALSGVAFAERTERDDNIVKSTDEVQVQGFEATPSGADGELLFGKYGATRDPAEIRRWDEKNG
jgi:hypothetical protein